MANQSSVHALIKIFLREISDLPGSLLQQHWSAIQKEKPLMNAISETNGLSPSRPVASECNPSTWGAAFLAGLPHLLMGLLIGAGKLGIFDIYKVSQTGTAIIGIGFALLVIGTLIFAWRLGWPLWSASWNLYGAWVTIAIIEIGIESLNLENSWIYTNTLFLVWIIVCVIGYFLILSKSKLHGLLSGAFLFPLLSVVMMEFIPNPIEGWMAIIVGLATALMAVVITRVGSLQLALRFVLGLNLAVGLAWAYISEYKMRDLPAGIPTHIPKFSNFLEFLVLYSIFGLGIVALPFILRSLWNFGRRNLIS